MMKGSVNHKQLDCSRGGGLLTRAVKEDKTTDQGSVPEPKNQNQHKAHDRNPESVRPPSPIPSHLPTEQSDEETRGDSDRPFADQKSSVDTATELLIQQFHQGTFDLFTTGPLAVSDLWVTCAFCMEGDRDRERERQRERQRETDRERVRQRETERERDRESETERDKETDRE
jgi:hypothetical protein